MGSQSIGDEEQNLAVVRRLLAYMLNGDIEQATGLINEDFELAIPLSAGGRTFRGREGFGKFVGGVGKMFDGGAKFEELRSVAIGDTVVLEVKALGQLHSGKQYENMYVHWFELKEGKVSRWREHADTKRAAEVLS